MVTITVDSIGSGHCHSTPVDHPSVLQLLYLELEPKTSSQYARLTAIL